MMSCLIILLNCQDLGLFWGSVQMYSGRDVVNIDFQPLGLKNDHKEGGGGFWGLKYKI
jgi:hypothetical protein